MIMKTIKPKRESLPANFQPRLTHTGELGIRGRPSADLWCQRHRLSAFYYQDKRDDKSRGATSFASGSRAIEFNFE